MSLWTVEEARRMVCPILSTNGTESCCANNCMAWRWDSRSSTTHVTTKDRMVVRDDGYVAFHPQPPDGDGWVQVFEWEGEGDKRRPKSPQHPGLTSWSRDNYGESIVYGKERAGYCGLAGKVTP